MIARNNNIIIGRFFSSQAGTVSPAKPKGGFFKGGFMGLLAGASVSLYIGYFHLVDEYSKSINQLISSVEELQGTTGQLKKHTEKVNFLESQLMDLKAKFATSDSLKASEKHVLKAHDDSVVEHLKLKNQVFELERSLNGLIVKLDKSVAPVPPK